MDLAKAEELFWQDGEVGEDCSAWLIAEVKRLQEEPSDLFYQLRDEVAQITKDRDHERFHREAAEAENERLQSSLTLSREEGRREGMMRAAEIAADQNFDHVDCDGCRTAREIATAIRSEAKGERAGCTWTLQDDETGAWASTCGELWSFIDGGPQENRVRFCHGCGKPVKAQPVLETE